MESSLSPATLWRSDSNRVTFFAGMAAAGLGGPSFLAYSSPTGIAVLRPGSSFGGGEMRENWLLTGFPGAAGWEAWDSPWALFLQHRPKRVQLDDHGLTCEFADGAGFVATLPLYGYYKPPQKGQEFLSRQGLEEKKLLTWEWSIVVARDPLTRLRYWSGATRRFPVEVEQSHLVDRRRDVVTLKHRFRWMEIPDDWGTRPIRIAPVSPVLGLVRTKGLSFPATFSRPPFDYGIPTRFGPFMGIADVDEYEVSFPVLRYLNETEAPTSGSGPSLDRLRTVVREAFANPETALRDGGSSEDLMRAITAAFWYAQALPYLEEPTRATVVARLRRFFLEEMLVSSRLSVPQRPTTVGLESGLLQALWAYAHRAGDLELIRERWSLIRTLWDLDPPSHWAAFGPMGVPALGDRAAPVAAYARLAFLAADREAYHRACGAFARELVHLYARQRGVRWIREQQPWHSMEPLDGEVYLTEIAGDEFGWRFDGPGYPQTAATRLYSERWTRFQDVDVARFFRDHLGSDLLQEWEGLRRRQAQVPLGFEDPVGTPSLLRWTSWMAPTAMTNWVGIGTAEGLGGTPSGVVAGCLAILRSAAPPQWERLFPGAPPAAPVSWATTQLPGADPSLVQHLRRTEGRPGWPSVEWPVWRTPTGKPWTFGEVRVGGGDAVVQDGPGHGNGTVHRTVWRTAP